METLGQLDFASVAQDLVSKRKYLMTVYLEQAKNIEETLNKLAAQIAALGIENEDIKGEDINLMKFKYWILSAIVDGSGITGLLNELEDWRDNITEREDKARLTEVIQLLQLEDCRDIYQYIKNIDQAVQHIMVPRVAQ